MSMCLSICLVLFTERHNLKELLRSRDRFAVTIVMSVFDKRFPDRPSLAS